MSKKTIIIIVAVLVVAIFAGIIAGFVFSQKNNNGPKETIKYNLTVDEMYCNIKDSKRILKLKMTIESTNQETIEKLSEKVFLVRDEVNKTVRNKVDEDLQGKEGQVKLQEEIKSSLVKLFEDESIINVYFDDFIIQ